LAKAELTKMDGVRVTLERGVSGSKPPEGYRWCGLSLCAMVAGATDEFKMGNGSGMRMLMEMCFLSAGWYLDPQLV
jgi:hypothetical protein